MITLLAIASYAAVPGDSATWSPLTTSPTLIECTEAGGKPYCRSTGVIGVPVATAVDVFARLDQHTAKMENISLVDRLEPDILHVVMDYPYPLSDRDYVAKFTRRTDPDGTEVFAWAPVEHAGAPPDSSVIRLPIDGEWKFKAEGANTRVTYIWMSDPGGNLPDANAVRKKAGYLAVFDIANAAGTKILSP